MVLKTSIICLLLIGYMGFFYYRGNIPNFV